MKRVLLFMAASALRDDLTRALEVSGYQPTPVEDVESARDRLASGAFSVALLSVRVDEDLRALEMVRKTSPGTHLVALGQPASMQLVVNAMKCGAGDFLRLPFDVRALEMVLAAGVPEALHAPSLMSVDSAMEPVLRHSRAAAVTEATIRIVGESGVGKELLARRIHQQSPRRGGPFVVVNCAGLPESLAESELFGHEQGAFTGAVEARVGQIATAQGGTLLLDEVSDLSLRLQPKLLRVLQERELQPVGASVPRPIDVRVIATTQHDLGELVEEGRFRADLFYRLDVITLHVPPLRDRPADLPLLARHFLKRIAQALSLEQPVLTNLGVQALQEHPFRGNVRELENLMRRAVLLFPGREIEVERLFGPGRPASQGSAVEGAKFNLRELERRTVTRSLAETGGNRTHAARMLGISVRTLRNKIRAYGLV